MTPVRPVAGKACKDDRVRRPRGRSDARGRGVDVPVLVEDRADPSETTAAGRGLSRYLSTRTSLTTASVDTAAWTTSRASSSADDTECRTGAPCPSGRPRNRSIPRSAVGRSTRAFAGAHRHPGCDRRHVHDGTSNACRLTAGTLQLSPEHAPCAAKQIGMVYVAVDGNATAPAQSRSISVLPSESQSSSRQLASPKSGASLSSEIDPCKGPRSRLSNSRKPNS